MINIKNIVRLDSDNEREYKDYIVNYGTQSGAKIGRALKVHREVVKRSEAAGIADRLVNVPIGKLRIILVEEESCIARLTSNEERDENPLVVYDTAMIGDIITPLKEMAKKKEVVILPETVLFDFDKYYLKKEARKVLNDLAGKIKKNKYKRIDIESHTDSIGSGKYNTRLSQNRAESIFKYFTKTHGLDKKIFRLKGYGETRPIASNKTKKERQKNRRGVITFYSD